MYTKSTLKEQFAYKFPEASRTVAVTVVYWASLIPAKPRSNAPR
jgi:hypothetical protein